ncbi:polycystic kidney disease protein 1-like 2 [Limulus polyphemus]|uniref:Polycystic kidney disease protein 1-like 2 n=1 Tax=Limulus polyphemus TaxID=6850 RepID=A0ABM1T542_LIMPO|nr:polycystic kidney disease protein 1-like 2 [Limulus polyphemus]
MEGGNAKKHLNWTEETNSDRHSNQILVFSNILIPGDSYIFSVQGDPGNGLIGTANYRITMNSPPKVGSCNVIPETGVTLETMFTVRCKGFQDEDIPMTYQFFYSNKLGIHSETANDRKGTLLKFRHYPEMSNTLLPVGDPSYNYTGIITVMVSDAFDMSVETNIFIQVLPLPSKSGQHKSELIKTFVTVTENTTSSPLEHILKSGDVEGALNMVDAISLLLNTDDASVDEKDDNVKENAQIRSKLLTSLEEVPLHSIPAVKQTSSVLTSVLSGNPKEVTIDSKDKAASILEDITSKLIEEGNSESISSKELLDVSLSVVNGMSALLNVTVGNATVVSEVDNTEYYKEPDYDYYTYPDPEEDERKTAQKKLCSVAGRVMELTKNIANELLRQVPIGEREVHLHTNAIGMWLKKVDESSYKRSSLGLSENNKIILPAKSNVDFSSIQNVINIKFIHSKLNPFLCHESSRYINTHTVLISLQDESKNEVAFISEEITNLETFLERKDRAAQRVKGIALVQNTSSLTDDDIILHKFVITQEYVSLQIVVHPKRKDEKFIVVIKFQSQPVIKDFSNASLIIPFTNAQNTTQYVLTVPESRLRASIGIYYLGVLPYVDITAEQLDLQHSLLQQAPRWEGSSDKKLSQGYTLSVFISRCFFWNEKEDQWSQKGCQVGPQTTETTIHCMCSHLSVFAASFLVTPNTIQLRTIPKLLKNMTINAIVLCSVCIVWGIYFLFIIWARRKDRNDVLKRAVVVLGDNKPSETYAYLISVYTGIWLNSGTTANVGIQLQGRKTSSRKVLLRDSNMKRMQQGSEDWYLLTTSESLGGLTGLKVWHDSGGANPSWYLKKILVRDIQTDRAWLFIAERWLDITTEGIHCHLKPTSQKEVSNFSLKFNDTTIRSFQDINLWSSILLRPPRSNFTRVQRTTCALSLVLITMLCNIMFYGINVYDIEDQLEIRNFNVSLSHIVIGLESSLIAFLLNVLIIILFRNVSPCPDRGKKQDQIKLEINPRLDEERKTVITEENVSDLSLVTEKTPVITDMQNVTKSVSNEKTQLRTTTSTSYQWWIGLYKDSIKPAHQSFWEDCDNEKCNLPQGWLHSVPVVNYLIYGADQDTTKINDTIEIPTHPYLSWWFIYIIWPLAILTLVTSSFFTILYGLTYGYKRSLEWLLSVVTALFHSFIIIQPLMSITFAVLLAWIIKKSPVLMDRNDNTALQSDEVYVTPSVQQMLSRKKENKLEDIPAEPLSKETHEKLKKLWIKQKFILKIIREVLVYVLFAVATFIAVHGHRSPLAYYGTKTAKDVFIRGHYTHSMPLKNVSMIEE